MTTTLFLLPKFVCAKFPAPRMPLLFSRDYGGCSSKELDSVCLFVFCPSSQTSHAGAAETAGSPRAYLRQRYPNGPIKTIRCQCLHLFGAPAVHTHAVSTVTNSNSKSGLPPPSTRKELGFHSITSICEWKFSVRASVMSQETSDIWIHSTALQHHPLNPCAIIHIHLPNYPTTQVERARFCS